MRDPAAPESGRELGPGRRAVVLVALAPVFLLLIPVALVALGRRLDAWWDLPPLLSPPASVGVGGLLLLGGVSLALWSNERLFSVGRGTPLPIVATRCLVVVAPYTSCRNPMVLATLVMYLGVAVLAGSPGAVVCVVLAVAALLLYVRRVEEPEMERRFGDEYRAYRARTPFLVPRLRRRP